MSRTIVIGDVHGCWAELQELLRATAAKPEDRLISVGDLVSKGPDSRSVIEWAMRTPNLECVLGNHERRLLRHWRAGTKSDEKAHDPETYRQLGDAYAPAMRYIEKMPLTVSGPGLLVVHAGFDPREGLEWQGAEALTETRRLADGRPWYEHYRDRTLVAFGHWAKRRPVVRPNAVGLDTGCVYGNALTALILPERVMVSIPARRAYVEKKRWDDELVPAGAL
ncbi:MAG: metallophosphoesterase [Elusimicrobiota bacterium]|nr:MAG: metallophosphoesterase [Elusimicrobiota bacterium]